MKNVVVFGASGYTGAELVRVIAGHPEIQITGLSADRKAGLEMGAVFAHLAHLKLPTLQKIEDISLDGVDLVFCALPHATSQKVIAALPESVKVCDLSADFRIRDPEVYAKWYGGEHLEPELQKSAVYGLTEFYRDEIAKARLVACTGCNAATAQFALRPLIAAGLINLDRIIIDLVVGVSGAGRSLKENLLHAELSEGTNAYGVGGTHRHLGELDQEFSLLAGRNVEVQFTPHLAPFNRGILATVYVEGDPEACFDALNSAYADEAFVHVLPYGQHPSTHHVRGSNLVHLGVVGDRRPGRTIILAALDNLTKGSSGMALQNANLMLGFPEGMGLDLVPLFP
ncbi:MAG: N-acetyl-gamma-glutamyl-phosphate reductase [Pseudomonadota bacterium]